MMGTKQINRNSYVEAKVYVSLLLLPGWVLLPLLIVLMLCSRQDMPISYLATVGIDLHFSRNKNWLSLDHIGRYVSSVIYYAL